MSPNARRSVDADQRVADALNQSASVGAKDPVTSSPRKRKQDAEITQSSPSKRRTIRATQSNTVTVTESDSPPRRVSTGLKKRTSLLSGRPVNRNNPYDMPKEAEDVPEYMFVPETKSRSLKGRKDNNGSPLKGHGVLNVTGATGVNLTSSDSPVKKKRGRPAGSAGRLKKARHATRDMLEDGMETELGIAREAKLIAAHGFVPSRIRDAQPQAETNTPSAGRRTSRRQAGLNAENGPEDDSTIEVSHTIEASVDEVGTDVRNQRRVRENSDQQEGDHASEIHAPEQDAATQAPPAVVNGGSTAPAEREVERSSAVEGIEAAIHLHNLSSAWTDILWARHKLWSAEKPDLFEVGQASSAARKLLRVYKQMYESEPPITFPTVQSQQTLRKVRDCCDLLVPGDQPRRNSTTVKALYRNIIPPLTESLGRCLRAGYLEGDLSYSACKELVGLLRLTEDLVDRAYEWQPRPTTLNSGSLSLMRNSIRPGIKVILSKYEQVMETHEEHIEAAKVVQALTEAQQRSSEALQRQKDRIRADALKATREYFASGCAHTPSSWQKDALLDHPKTMRHQQEQERVSQLENGVRIYDIDDLESTSRTSPLVQASRSRNAVHLSKQRPEQLRPTLHREQTEDIPPPATPPWENSQTARLIRELQYHTGENRYYNIFNTAREHGHPLRGFSMEDIARQALFLKKTMTGAGEIDNQPDEDWNWLLSVEG